MLKHGGTDQGQSRAAETDGFAVHVVLTLAPGRERETPASVGPAREELQKVLARIRRRRHRTGRMTQVFLVCAQSCPGLC